MNVLQVEDEDSHDLERWIQDVYDQFFVTVRRIWNLHPEHRWNYFEMMGNDSLHEVILLKTALAELERIWRKPFRGKKKKAHKEITEGRSNEVVV